METVESNRGNLGRARLSFACAASLAATALVAAPARAAFHLWNVTQVYSNASGTLQFIELSDTAGGQNFVGGQQISIVNSGHTQADTFTLPAGNLPGNTLNHTLLFGTAGIHAAGAPTPDYIIPNGFLFTDGGTLNFFGANGGAYAALPIDGTLSRNWNDGTAINSPKNFAGQTGTIIVPEPATAGLFAGTGVALFLGMRRRARK